MVTYQYDAWGKLINMDGSLASTVGIQNPFRYRGYYYDTETGLYYLQSRYYNPEISRFISRDDASLHKGQTGVSANLYAYANNNPVIYGDPDGHSVTSMILNMASSVLSLVCLVNPVTGGPRFAAALAAGVLSFGITIYDYNQSINHLTERLRTHKIKQLTYNANIKICNLWYKETIVLSSPAFNAQTQAGPSARRSWPACDGGACTALAHFQSASRIETLAARALFPLVFRASPSTQLPPHQDLSSARRTASS